MHGEIFPSFSTLLIALPPLLCWLGTVGFFALTPVTCLAKERSYLQKPLPSHACFQLNSNLAIAKMRHYKDLVQFLQTHWLYNACSSTVSAIYLPLQIGCYDFVQDIRTQADRATLTASRGKYCCLRGKLM